MEQGQVVPEGVNTSSSSPLKKLSKKAAAVVASTALAVSSCAQTASNTSQVSEQKVTSLDLASISIEEYEKKVQSMGEEELDAEFARLSVFTGDKSLTLKERKYYGKFKVVCTDEIQKRTVELKSQSDKLKAENAETKKQIAELREFKQALDSLKK